MLVDKIYTLIKNYNIEKEICKKKKIFLKREDFI